jgi:hypothetical protein
MRTVCLALAISALLCCARVEAITKPVEVEMNNVDLHLQEGVTLHVRHLRGAFEAAAQRNVPYLDDPKSYSVVVESGVIAIDIASLNALMTQTLAGDNSNVDNLKVAVDDKGNISQKGKIDKGVNIPFDVKAGIEATPDGKLRVFTKSVKGFGVPMKPLMKMFSIEMDDLLKVKPGRGVVVRDNDLILDPSLLLPAPSMRGSITNARIEGDAIVQTFGNGAVRHLSPPPIAKNYIYWRGGSLSFGKLTMTETDLELVDADPKDAFDFSVAHWNDQLVAGYSKTTGARGLKAHVPDYNDLKR